MNLISSRYFMYIYYFISDIEKIIDRLDYVIQYYKVPKEVESVIRDGFVFSFFLSVNSSPLYMVK